MSDEDPLREGAIVFLPCKCFNILELQVSRKSSLLTSVRLVCLHTVEID